MLSATSIADIAAVAVLLYNAITMIRGRRAASVLTGVAVLMAAYGVARWFHLGLLEAVLLKAAEFSPIALIVMFQTEIRRFLVRMGQGPWFGLGKQLERRDVYEDVLLAVNELHDGKTGALIVIEGDVGLKTFVESGVAMDAQISRDLLCAIFDTEGPLHDGAVIIQGDRISAAACFLPLAVAGANVQSHHGTRHRAAVGVSEESDALAIVVSEETGEISIARSGVLYPDIGLGKLQAHLRGESSGKTERRRGPSQIVLAVVSLSLAILLWIWTNRHV